MSNQRPSNPQIDFFTLNNDELKVHQARLVKYLTRHGYRRLYGESKMKPSLVKIYNGIVERTSKSRLRDFVMDKVRNASLNRIPDKYNRVDFEDTLIRGANVYFGDNLIGSLPSVELEFKSDTENESFFYFDNGFVQVTANGYELKDYSELDGAIWADQIIDRDFEPMRDDQALAGSVWCRFLRNVMGGNQERIDALWSVLGYLLHGYKDRANAKAIVFLDEAISDVPSGRTGKSLVAQSLQELVPVQRIDARNFKFGGQFSFQSIGIEHQVIDFNDAREDFDFERLFSAITDDMQVERKYQDEITIAFEDSPKFLVSTNHVIEGEGASFEDRVLQIEFAPHYGKEYTPVDEFGHRLFVGWDFPEWRRFDNLMMLIEQKYLRDGLQTYRHKNLKKRKLRQETSREFAEWIIEFAKQKPGEYKKSALFETFKTNMKSRHGEDYAIPWGQKKFTRLCHKYGRIYTGDKLPERKSGSDRYITIPELGDEAQQ